MKKYVAESIGTFWLVLGGAGSRFPGSQLLPYIVAQVLGGLLAGGVLFVIASGQAGFED